MNFQNAKNTNTRKKYIKLQGYETPTPENEARARKYMNWYAANMKKLEYYVQGSGGVFDEDIFNDTFLRVYDAIALKGLHVKDYTGCFLRSYRNTYINSKKSNNVDTISLDGSDCNYRRAIDLSRLNHSSFNSYQYEEIIETINSEVMAYVQDNYDEVSVSLFEMYVGLAPDISYKRLANMLGYQEFKIWPVIGKIKKDVNKRFGKRKDILLSKVEY